MRYRIKKIVSEGVVFGAFAADEQGHITTVLIRDYWFDLPCNRQWKTPMSLDSASSTDLEPEVLAAHRNISVSTDELIVEIGADQASPATVIDPNQRYRDLMIWLMQNITP